MKLVHILLSNFRRTSTSQEAAFVILREENAIQSELSYKMCQDAGKEMFCTVCMKWYHPSVGSRWAWSSKGITDWHQASVIKSTWRVMVSQRCCFHSKYVTSGRTRKIRLTAKQAENRVNGNPSIIYKLMRSAFILAKNMIPCTIVYTNIIAFQAANGDHITHGASNAQYTSKYSAMMFLEALNTWLLRKQLHSQQSKSVSRHPHRKTF